MLNILLLTVAEVKLVLYCETLSGVITLLLL